VMYDMARAKQNDGNNLRGDDSGRLVHKKWVI